MANTTPTVKCPTCEHPINDHARNSACAAEAFGGCSCRLDPNTVAVAAVQTALFGELTQP